MNGARIDFASLTLAERISALNAFVKCSTVAVCVPGVGQALDFSGDQALSILRMLQRHRVALVSEYADALTIKVSLPMGDDALLGVGQDGVDGVHVIGDANSGVRAGKKK